MKMLTTVTMALALAGCAQLGEISTDAGDMTLYQHEMMHAKGFNHPEGRWYGLHYWVKVAEPCKGDVKWIYLESTGARDLLLGNRMDARLVRASDGTCEVFSIFSETAAKVVRD